MDERKLALQCDERDNVATVFANGITAGMEVDVQNKRGDTSVLRVLNDVPYGHKVALCSIQKGEHVLKYGESIGAALRDISKGEYVHIHNIAALRGCGDL